VPIFRKRRIFRAAGLPSRGPARGMALVVLASALIVSGGTWFGLQPSQAPASTAPPGHLTAEATQTRVVDGNTIMLGDRAVQLAGVRATQRGAVCEGSGGVRFDCGAAAANGLADLIRDSAIDCALNGSGQGGRPLAVCSAGGREVNMAMIASGWARAELGMVALSDAERHARADRRGLWAGPWVAAD
jgi:endonuclease YncB( thermonuclease family)